MNRARLVRTWVPALVVGILVTIFTPIWWVPSLLASLAFTIAYLWPLRQAEPAVPVDDPRLDICATCGHHRGLHELSIGICLHEFADELDCPCYLFKRSIPDATTR